MAMYRVVTVCFLLLTFGLFGMAAWMHANTLDGVNQTWGWWAFLGAVVALMIVLMAAYDYDESSKR